MPDALTSLAEEDLLVALNGWSAPFALALPHVVNIVAQLPALAEKRDRVEPCAGNILQAYVNGCWQARGEATVRIAESELAGLQAHLEALREAIAGLSEETRRLLDRDLAIASRRLWYLWNEGGRHELGLARSSLEVELLQEVARQWTAPLAEGEERSGRRADHAADFVACAALETYEDLTGRRVNRNFHQSRGSGEFIDFLQQLYTLFGIDKGAENRARKAIELRRGL